MFEELWKFIQAHYDAKRYHLVLGNIQLLIPLINHQCFSNPSDLAALLKLLQDMFIQLDSLAQEFHFRDHLYRYWIDPIYQRIKTIDAQLAEAFLQHLINHIPRSDQGRIRYAKYEHNFQKFYTMDAADPNKQLREDREKRIVLLEADLERNQYEVWSDVVLSYLDAQLQAGQVVTAVQLTALLNFLEDLFIKIQSLSEVTAEELWHDVFIAQRLLSHSLMRASLGQDFSCVTISNWWQVHQCQAAGLFLLPVIAQYISDHAIEDCFAWYTLVQQINTQLTSHVPTSQIVLFVDHRLVLQTMRVAFNELSPAFNAVTSQVLVKTQQQFTQATLNLLNQFVQNVAELLGEAPCDFALCALGSTSREDRRPYSDVELVLLYDPKPNAKPAHLHTYLYYLISGVEYLIKQCGESHKKKDDSNLLQFAGFHLDDSTHLLLKELIGTPQEIMQKFIIELLAQWQGKKHPWLDDESFYSLLSLVVINAGSYGSEQVFTAYQQRIQAYLNGLVAPADQLQVLTQSLRLSASSSFMGLKRREAIAISCLYDVVQKSNILLSALNQTDTVNIKDAFYKPLAYLALNLKLFYGLNAKHPAEIFTEAASKLSWGEHQVLKLLQTALSYITHIQVKLHFKHGHQEERFIWLGVADDHNTEVSCLSTEEYAGLNLIKDGLILPLCQCLDKRLKDSIFSFSLLNVLPYLLKSYLTARNEPWLHRWTQHDAHPLSFKALLAHPLINVLADYPSPDGWSPRYEQTLQHWSSQLQTLLSAEPSLCLIEGILTSKQNKSYLPTEIVNQLFDATGKFKGNVHHSPQSKVSKIIWLAPGQEKPTAFYFKVKAGNEAGLMGREYAVINLHQLLGGLHHIALGWPLKLTYRRKAKGDKVYYCWVSEEVPGSSLAEVMQNAQMFEVMNAMFDNQSYSHLFITHYLTCPEDAQPDNLKIEPTHEGTFRLYGLDVGQSFVGTYDDTRKVLVVKTMIYLLESAIRQALDTRVLTRLMLLEPHALIKYWQVNLNNMNKLFQPLFEAELKKTRVPQAEWFKHNRLIDLAEDVHRCVQERLMLLSDWLYLHSYQKPSGLRLLKALDPAVALSYQSLLGKIKTPENFYKIDPKAYVKNPNTGKMYSTTTYPQIKQNSLTPERLQCSLDLDEAYFAIIDFKKLQDETEQRYVLALLQAAIQNKKRFTYLNLAGCTVINESQLFDLLQKIPEVKELDLQDCPQFNLSTLFSLFSFKINQQLVRLSWEYDVLCPNLRKLSVTLEGDVQILDIAQTISGRKQLLDLIINLQQQLSIYLNKLLAWLNDKDDYYRATAAENLGKLKARMSTHQVMEVIEKLLTKLNGKNNNVREAVASSLSQLLVRLTANQAKGIIKKLLIKLDDEKWRVQVTIISSLSKLEIMLTADQINEMIKKLLAKLDDEIRYVRVTAAISLSKLMARIPENLVSAAMKKLLSILNDDDLYMQAIAAQSLGELALRIPNDYVSAVIEKLLARLKHKNKYDDKEVHRAIANSLGQLAVKILVDHQVWEVVNALLAKLDDVDAYMRTAAFCSICQLAAKLSVEQVDVTIEKLLVRLGDVNNNVEKTKVKYLSQLVNKISIERVGELVEKLLARLCEDKWYVRVSVARSLGQLAARLSVEQVITVLEKLLDRFSDKDDYVRAAAVSSLNQLAAKLTKEHMKAVIEKVLAKLNIGDVYTRTAAVCSLGQLAARASKDQMIEVIEKLQDKLSDKDDDVVIAAIRTLSQLVARTSKVQILEVIEKLMTKINDKNKYVRIAAVSSLNQLAAKLTEEEFSKIIDKLLVSFNGDRFEQLVGIISLDELVAKAAIEQVIKVFEMLLAKFNNKNENEYVRATIAACLGRLANKLPFEQVSAAIKELLGRFDEENSEVRAAVTRSFSRLTPKASIELISKVIYKLMQKLNYRDIYLQDTLTKVFSFSASLRLLQNCLLNANENVVDELQNLNYHSHRQILSNLFPFLDQTTLLEIVPQVNTAWRCWQKVYLQQQAQRAREQNLFFLDKAYEEEVVNFYTRFQHSQSVEKANIQKDEALINASFKDTIQNRTNVTLELTSKPSHVAQSTFFQHKKNTQVTVPKQYTVQMNQQTVVFEVKTVIGDGDCGYTAFGITRLQAHQLLVEHLNKISHIIKPALQEALRTQAFIDMLRSKGSLTQALSNAYADYLEASHGGEMPQQVLDALDRAGEDLTILLAYIEYDLKAKQIDDGWSHPCILFALAEIQGIELHIWQYDEQDELVPHRQHSSHIPTQVTQRTDLLFVNGNHFERLEPIDNLSFTPQLSNSNTLKL